MPKISDEAKARVAALRTGAVSATAAPNALASRRPLAETTEGTARATTPKTIGDTLDRLNEIIVRARKLGIDVEYYVSGVNGFEPARAVLISELPDINRILNETAGKLEAKIAEKKEKSERVVSGRKAEDIDLSFLERPLVYNAEEKSVVSVPDHINLDDLKPEDILSFGQGFSMQISNKLGGFGSLNKVYAAKHLVGSELVDVAVKVSKFIKSLDGPTTKIFRQFIINEARNLHVLQAALAREPTENFPDGVRRNYYPIPYSGTKIAEKGVIIESLCLGKNLLEHCKEKGEIELLGTVLQFLHSLAIAEGANILNSDFKGGELAVKGEIIVAEDEVKFCDWNVTYPAKSQYPEGSAHERYETARAKSSVQFIIVEWLSILDALYDEKGTCRAVGGYCGNALDFYIDEKRQNTHTYELVKTIAPDKISSKLFAFMIYETIIEQRFKSVRAFYQRVLALYRSEIGSSEIEQKAQKLASEAPGFNARFEARMAEYNAIQEENEGLAEQTRKET